MINQIGGSSWCPGNCLAIVSGRVILENHLSTLCLLISVGLVPEITTYFLGRGPAGGRQPSARAYGMRLWTAYRVSSREKESFALPLIATWLLFWFPFSGIILNILMPRMNYTLIFKHFPSMLVDFDLF